MAASNAVRDLGRLTKERARDTYIRGSGGRRGHRAGRRGVTPRSTPPFGGDRPWGQQRQWRGHRNSRWSSQAAWQILVVGMGLLETLVAEVVLHGDAKGLFCRPGPKGLAAGAPVPPPPPPPPPPGGGRGRGWWAKGLPDTPGPKGFGRLPAVGRGPAESIIAAMWCGGKSEKKSRMQKLWMNPQALIAVP